METVPLAAGAVKVARACPFASVAAAELLESRVPPPLRMEKETFLPTSIGLPPCVTVAMIVPVFKISMPSEGTERAIMGLVLIRMSCVVQIAGV